MSQGWRALAGLVRPHQGPAAGLSLLLGRAMGFVGSIGGTTPASLSATGCQLQQVRGMANHRHKKVIKMAKGYRGRTNCFRIAVQKVEKALQYAYRDRKVKKRDFRTLWIQRLNAAVQQYGFSYNRFIPGLRLANITMDRKVLSELAVTEPYSFKAVVDTVKSALPAAAARNSRQAVAAAKARA